MSSRVIAVGTLFKADSMATPDEDASVTFSATAETMICFSQPGEFARDMCGWPRQMAPEASKPAARTRLRTNEAGIMAAGIVPHTLDRMAIPQSIDLPGIGGLRP